MSNSTLSPQGSSSLCSDEAVADRVAELAARANEGELTAEEQIEYESIVNAMDSISILRLKARRIMPGLD
jgi:hypothetical protein